ncbi:MAG: hypothetical protein K6V73_06420 [Firmicutes bacterium]|nr:hypothetical protein [Bacillota bacterium]
MAMRVEITRHGRSTTQKLLMAVVERDSKGPLVVDPLEWRGSVRSLDGSQKPQKGG